MNKEKAELYARLFARTFLIAETTDAIDTEEYSKLEYFSKHLLDLIQEQAEKDLTPEELEYYNEETDSPNRYAYE